MEFLNKRATSKYPDLATLSEIYHELFHKEEIQPDGWAGDDKTRPLLLLLAVLSKVQERAETERRGREVRREEYQEVLELAGYYWHLQHKLGKGLREGINNVPSTDLENIAKLLEKNREKMRSSLGLEMVGVSVSELHHREDQGQVAVSGTKVRSLTAHTPDYVITVQESHRAVVFTVLGTRVFPTPNPGDVIMDLACRTETFLDGEAHAGMVLGHRNLVKTALPTLIEELRKRPGFSLLVVGYSLGAALAQLFLLDLQAGDLKGRLPAGVEVRGLLFGIPPVYAGNISPLENVLMISNNNDGITGASLKALKDVMIKTRAIHSLNLQRRVLCKMVLNIEGPEEDENQTKATTAVTKGVNLKKSFMRKTTSSLNNIVNKQLGTSDDQWSLVEDAVNNVQLSSLPELRFVGNNLLVLKRTSSKEELGVSLVSGLEELREMTREVRLKTGMINDHMPWAYNKIFSGYNLQNTAVFLILILSGLGSPDVAKNISLGALDRKLHPHSLYPDLSTLINS